MAAAMTGMNQPLLQASSTRALGMRHASQLHRHRTLCQNRCRDPHCSCSPVELQRSYGMGEAMKDGLCAMGLSLLVACSGTGGAGPPGERSDASGDVLSDGATTEVIIKYDTRDVGSEQLDFEVTNREDAVPARECDPGEGCFLDQCDENADCQSGWCVQHLGEGVCSQMCQDECPSGWSCRQVAGTDPDLVYVCVSEYANLCRPCTLNSDCTSVGRANDACIDYGPNGNFCGGPCGTASQCPWGFSCKAVTSVEGSALEQCVNDTGECPCTDNSVGMGLTTPCSVTNAFGTCIGKRTCTVDGLSACDGIEASEESCNGLDDDCDGEADEPHLAQGKYFELCSDGNDCTEDKCMSEDGCVNKVLVSGPCEDGDPCTVADHCEAGTCLGDPVECHDDNPCTDDLCTTTGGCEYPSVIGACDDGDPCTVADQCDDGVCAGYPVSCECQVDADCEPLEDGDLCNGTLVCDTSSLPYKCVVEPGTEKYCPEPEGEDSFCLQAWCDPASGECSFLPALEGFLCDNGDLCTVNEKCQAGLCTGGTPVNCTDGNPCTDDGCDSQTGCAHLPNTDACDDGDPCTLADQCSGSKCVGGPPLQCEDGNDCTQDSCAPDAGCLHEAAAGPCDDGNACTTDDACNQGKCVGGVPLVCADSNPCTDHACDPVAGCVTSLNQAPCDDGDACSLGDHCHLAECIAASTLVCDDDNPCTKDACEALQGCLHAPTGGACDDNDGCTWYDQCADGQCAGVACDQLGMVCSEDQCSGSACVALAFDGDGDEVSVASHSWAGDLTTLTVEAWVKSDGAQVANLKRLVTRWGQCADAGHDASFSLHMEGAGGQSLLFGVCTDEEQQAIFVSGNLKQAMKDGTWHHIAGVWESEVSIRVYLDGKLLAALPVAQGTLAKASLPLRIGGDELPSRYFYGRMAGVRLSSSARYTTAFVPATTLAADAATLDSWDFSEGEGETVHDSAPAAQHGTILGASWVLDGPSPACCAAECEGKECGQDGCGGSCGLCPGPQDVCTAGQCECLPECDGKECGDDGCGGDCAPAPPLCDVQEGVCLGATRTAALCVANQWQMCDAAAYTAHSADYQPEPESACDGLDNDCDGGKDEGCPGDCGDGYVLAFDITDDPTDQMPNGCAWLNDVLFSKGTKVKLEWWGADGKHYGPSTWDLTSHIDSIRSHYLTCSGSNYAMPSEDQQWFMTIVVINNILAITGYGDDPADGTDYYYGRIENGYTGNDEVYGVGFATWELAWSNRYLTGDRFRACYK